MFIRDVLLPRAILVNAALYATVALSYTVILFALETSSPGKYVFSDSSKLATIFSYLVICSWPVLLFGALILLAVRVGGNVRRRRRRRKRSNTSKSKQNSLPNNTDTSRKQPPSTTPPAQLVNPSSIPQNSWQSLPAHSNSANSLARNESAARSKPSTSPPKKKPRVAKGYVSVTRPQRIFAVVGFLWVSLGLACSAAAAVIVFLGQRERFREQEVERGTEAEVWKSWVIPIFCGIVMAVVFTVLSITTLLKVFSTMAAKGREIETPAQSENDDSVGGDLDEEDMLFADGEPTAPPLTPAVSAAQPAAPAPVVRGRVRMGTSGYHAPKQLPYQPDQKTVDRLMRQLRDMGFPNPHQNLAALQASSFDLEKASDKLTNAQTV